MSRGESGKPPGDEQNEITVRNMQRKHPVDRGRAQRILRHALDCLGIDGVRVSVAFVGDRRIRELNRAYRATDRATDVLSFSQEGGPVPAGRSRLLGDVVISVARAADQAERSGQGLEKEIDVLLVHGLLHLAGYDHLGTDEERAEMEKAQTGILERWRP